MSQTRISAVVTYEARMHWRRRAIVFLLLIFMIGLIGFTILTKEASDRPPMQVSWDNGVLTETPLPVDQSMADFARHFSGTAPAWIETVSYAQYMNDRLIVMLLCMALMPLLIGITPIFAETIPLDRQNQVRELLETTPLTKSAYLAGKVAGLWATLLIGLLICAVIYGVVALLLFGTFDPVIYVGLWVVVIFPSVLITAAFAVLIPSGVNSRRKAVLLGALLVPVSMALFSMIYITMSVSGMGLSGAVPLANVATYAEVISGLFGSIAQVIAPFAVILVIVWALAWLWTTWGDSRSPMTLFSRRSLEGQAQ